MHIFRWVMGSLSVLLVAGSILCVVLFMMVDIEVWIRRARSFRRAAFSVILLWFNVEVWGSVLYTLIHW